MIKRICSGKTRPRQSIFLPLLILLFLSIPLFSHAADTFTCKVVGISDRDTISVIREGKAVKVRPHGIESPERKQPYGTRANQFTSDRAFRNEVTVYVKDTDSYERIVGEVILPDGLSLNKELVYVGLAWWHKKYALDDRILKALEAGARADKRGLWADEKPIPPWAWRKIDRGRPKE